MRSADSYSALERRWLSPARRLLSQVYSPIIRVLAAFHISPNTLSISQVLVGLLSVMLMPAFGRLAFFFFVLSIALDGMDGALARETNRVSRFGALLDQYCDHLREVIVISGLAFYGALNPFLAGLYGVCYPGFNLTLYLCNVNHAPLPIALKSYLVVYPAIFAYLWLGINVLDAAVATGLVFMGAFTVFGLWRLRSIMTQMDETEP